MRRRSNRLTTTGGSDEREARAMSAPLLRFELGEEAARLRSEEAYLGGDRNARTLVKSGPFRLVLVAFRASALFDEDDQRGTVALHVLEGRLSLTVGQERVEIGASEVGVVSHEHTWSAVAAEDGLMLLHLAWPPEPGSVEG